MTGLVPLSELLDLYFPEMEVLSIDFVVEFSPAAL